jgi:hypothetical protein
MFSFHYLLHCKQITKCQQKKLTQFLESFNRKIVVLQNNLAIYENVYCLQTWSACQVMIFVVPCNEIINLYVRESFVTFPRLLLRRNVIRSTQERDANSENSSNVLFARLVYSLAFGPAAKTRSCFTYVASGREKEWWNVRRIFKLRGYDRGLTGRTSMLCCKCCLACSTINSTSLYGWKSVKYFQLLC